MTPVCRRWPNMLTPWAPTRAASCPLSVARLSTRLTWSHGGLALALVLLYVWTGIDVERTSPVNLCMAMYTHGPLHPVPHLVHDRAAMQSASLNHCSYQLMLISLVAGCTRRACSCIRTPSAMSRCSLPPTSSTRRPLCLSECSICVCRNNCAHSLQ